MNLKCCTCSRIPVNIKGSETSDRKSERDFCQFYFKKKVIKAKVMLLRYNTCGT